MYPWVRSIIPLSNPQAASQCWTAGSAAVLTRRNATSFCSRLVANRYQPSSLSIDNLAKPPRPRRARLGHVNR